MLCVTETETDLVSFSSFSVRHWTDGNKRFVRPTSRKNHKRLSSLTLLSHNWNIFFLDTCQCRNVVILRSISWFSPNVPPEGVRGPIVLINSPHCVVSVYIMQAASRVAVWFSHVEDNELDLLHSFSWFIRSVKKYASRSRGQKNSQHAGSFVWTSQCSRLITVDLPSHETGASGSSRDTDTHFRRPLQTSRRTSDPSHSTGNEANVDRRIMTILPAPVTVPDFKIQPSVELMWSWFCWRLFRLRNSEFYTSSRVANNGIILVLYVIANEMTCWRELI
jgi:hypothetical protein